jgi:hypothetical protein
VVGLDWPWIILCVVLGKAANNAMKVWYCGIYQGIYLSYLNDEKSKDYVPGNEAIVLFKCANVQNKNPLFAAALAQYPTREEPAATYILQMFAEATKEYGERCKETFNPLYWFKAIIYLPSTLIFLPEKTLVFLGLFPGKTCKQIIQWIWWLVAPIAGWYFFIS